MSLVPSLTEFIADIGLEGSLVGRTKFCIHPESIRKNVPVMGGTKIPNIERIRKAAPDLVICNKEENRREDVEEISGFAKVEVTDISGIEDALRAMKYLGEIVGKGDGAKRIVVEAERQLSLRPSAKPLRAVYLIWRNPYMTIGNDTYIHDVMKHWGLENCFGHLTRYPELSPEAIRDANPDVILLSSEPYPFKEKHITEISGFAPQSKVMLVDGEWFSWYGSRMVEAFKGLNKWRGILNDEF